MESSTEIQPQNNLNEVNRRNFSAKEKLKFNDTIIEIDDNRPGKINDLNDDQQKHYQQQTDDLGGYDGEMTESEYQMRFKFIFILLLIINWTFIFIYLSFKNDEYTAVPLKSLK